jgi:hypothetical protein
MIKFHLGLKRLSAWGAFKEVPIFTVGPLCFLNGRRLLTHNLTLGNTGWQGWLSVKRPSLQMAGRPSVAGLSRHGSDAQKPVSGVTRGHCHCASLSSYDVSS